MPDPRAPKPDPENDEVRKLFESELVKNNEFKEFDLYKEQEQMFKQAAVRLKDKHAKDS